MASLSNYHLLVGFLCMICSLLGFCSGDQATASFIFGDSLVDAGNNNYLQITLSRADHEPNGIDLLPFRMPTGRYTNGRTIADIVGQELGLKDLTPPYLAPNTSGEVVLKGVNYASGGGGILNHTGYIFIERINLDAQIDYYANTRQDIISAIGMPAASNLLHNAIYSVTVGSNDFINNYLFPILSVPERTFVSPGMFVDSMIKKYRLQLARLHELDARKIIVSNVGPIGCIPYVREVSQSAGTDCAETYNMMARSFNEKLKILVTELNSALEGALYVYADVYNIVLDIIQNHSKYGFDVADSACCALAGRFGGLIPCGPTSQLCPDRTKYVFWDPYHPSDTANIIIASRLLNGDYNDISPMNIRKLARA